MTSFDSIFIDRRRALITGYHQFLQNTPSTFVKFKPINNTKPPVGQYFFAFRGYSRCEKTGNFPNF